MRIAVIGTGIIGRTLAGRLAAAGQQVTFGVRRPDAAAPDVDPPLPVAPVAEAVAGADAVILAIPGGQIPDFAAEHAEALAGTVVIDATNDVKGGGSGFNHAADWAQRAPGVQVARAFSTLGWENFANPDFGGVTASLFWCGPDGGGGQTVEAVIRAVGLDPVRIGDLSAADTLDGVTRLWFQLVSQLGGRELALRLLRR
jgi:8-hydroxy-5-deazaflavin:NADPH oxidoreductase